MNQLPEIYLGCDCGAELPIDLIRITNGEIYDAVELKSFIGLCLDIYSIECAHCSEELEASVHKWVEWDGDLVEAFGALDNVDIYNVFTGYTYGSSEILNALHCFSDYPSDSDILHDALREIGAFSFSYRLQNEAKERKRLEWQENT